MNSFILKISSRYVSTLLLIFAVLALLRGHNMPGGGFIGGLLASLSVIITGLAYSPKYVSKRMRINPKTYIGMGLGLILLSLTPSILFGQNIMKGFWYLSNSIELKIGTPLVFDFGVFFIVFGVTLLLFFTLSIKK